MDHTQINPTHECRKQRNEADSNQINKEMNSEQVISDKRVLVNRDGEDKSKNNDGCIIMRFGRIIRKPDRLAY